MNQVTIEKVEMDLTRNKMTISTILKRKYFTYKATGRNAPILKLAESIEYILRTTAA